MPRLNLSQALRQLKRAAERVSVYSMRFKAENSIELPRTRVYDATESYAKYCESQNILNKYKVAIEQASLPVREKILAMAELKSRISTLKFTSVQHGKFPPKWADDVESEWDAVYKEKDINAMIALLESYIDTLQSRIDEFNVTTFVELPELIVD